MKLMESSIPANYSELVKKENFDIPAQYVEQLFDVAFVSIANFMAIVKIKGKVALKITDMNDTFLFAAVVNYHPNDDVEMPGNYTFECTFDIDDIEDAKVYSMSDVTYKRVLTTVAFDLHRMQFNSDGDMFKTYKHLFKSLCDWLQINNGEIQHSKFIATSAVEADEKVFSIVPDGTLKRLIKDDASLETDVE